MVERIVAGSAPKMSYEAVGEWSSVHLHCVLSSRCVFEPLPPQASQVKRSNGYN